MRDIKKLLQDPDVLLTVAERKRARLLLRELKRVAAGKIEGCSWASPVFADRKRLNSTAATWVLAELYDTRLITLWPKNWVFTREELLALKPHILLERLRAVLKDRGARANGGWGIFCLHGEQNQGTGLFHLHIHGLIAGSMIDACNRLRKLPNFRTSETKSPRVRIHRRPPDDLPHPLSYLLQSWWPLRWRSVNNSDLYRKSRRRRLRPEDHALWLLWISQLGAADLCLLFGLQATTRGLKPTMKSSTYRNKKKGRDHM